jgi:phage-related protein
MAGPLDRAFVEIVPDFDRFPAAVRKGVADAGKDIERELERSLGRAEKNASRDGGRIGAATGKSFATGLSDTLSSISGIKLPTGGFVVLSGAMSAAAAAAVQLAAALAPAVGIVAGLPSVLGVAAAGMTTLNVATAGVGEAFSSALTDDAAAFSEAMEGLAPNVQLAAQALRDLDPELEALRNSVQDAFFEGFDGVLNQLAETLLGPVTAGMVSVAGSLNGIITGLTNVATSAEGVTFVSQSFEIMAGILERLQEPLTLLFSALLSVGSAINEAFGEEAGAGLAGLITQFSAFLEQAAASGDAVGWVNDALVVFQQIGDILAPIAGILGSIGAAAQTTGGNILGAFGTALQTFDAFLASAQGQDVLISIFEALNQVGAAFGTVLAGIAPALPPIIDGIASILEVVAPLLGPLSELVGSVLTALAPVLTAVASAIQPIIGPLTTIIELLGGILIGAITAVMPLINLLAELLGAGLGAALEVVGSVLQAVAPIFDVLFQALGPIIEALSPLFELLGVVAGIIGDVLAPIIQVLGDILLWIVDTIIVPVLVPAIEILAEILTGLLGDAVTWIVDLITVGWEALGAIFEWLKNQFQQRVTEMKAQFKFLQDAFKVGADFIKNNVIEPIKTAFNSVKTTVSNALNNTKESWNTFVTFIKGIPDKISGALSNMFSPLATGFKSAINSVIRAWNNLSFTIPSVNIPGIGDVGGATISTPNIPLLASGALATGPTLAMVGEGRFNEAILPLGDPRVDALLASALGRAGAGNNVTAGGAEATAAAASIGDMHFLVKIGDRELNDVIVERIDESNRVMLRRARSGTRRNV